MVKLAIGVIALLWLASSAAPVTAAGNDALIDAAKREGEVVYYASMNLGEANAIIGHAQRAKNRSRQSGAGGKARRIRQTAADNLWRLNDAVICIGPISLISPILRKEN